MTNSCTYVRPHARNTFAAIKNHYFIAFFVHVCTGTMLWCVRFLLPGYAWLYFVDLIENRLRYNIIIVAEVSYLESKVRKKYEDYSNVTKVRFR